MAANLGGTAGKFLNARPEQSWTGVFFFSGICLRLIENDLRAEKSGAQDFEGGLIFVSEHVREIAVRLRAMREISGMTVEELGARLTISAQEYAEMETGNVDIPVSVLCEAADIFGISVTELLTGDRAKLKMYSVVRKGRGIGVERTAGYNYAALAHGFAERRVEPLLVTIEPKDESAELHMNTHGGHEFHYCLEGEMRLYIGGHELTIREGDSVYFDSKYPHAMRALNNRPVKLIVIVIK